jgi:hypothetical protein
VLRGAAVDTICYKLDAVRRTLPAVPSYHAGVRKALLVVALLLAAAPAFAGPGGWGAIQLLPQAQGDRRHMPPPGGRDRSDERRRLREEVREGRLPRDEAVRQYRERFPERQHHERRRMSHEEREQLRRDIHEANRNLRRR